MRRRGWLARWMGMALSLLMTGPVFSYPAEIRVYRPQENYFGLSVRDITQADVDRLKLTRETGVYIEEVQESSPAQRAGLRAGELILEYGGIPVLSVRHLSRLVSETPPGRQVELGLLREGQVFRTKVQAGEQAQVSPYTGRRTAVVEREEMPSQVLSRVTGEHVFFFWQRPRLGITGASLTVQLAEFLGVSDGKGVLVAEVMENSPASRAGLEAGDVITAVDGQSVGSLHELSARLKSDRHEVEIVRDRGTRKVNLELNRIAGAHGVRP